MANNTGHVAEQGAQDVHDHGSYRSYFTGFLLSVLLTAIPFAIVMVGLAWALVKDLRNDPLMVRRRYAAAAVEKAVVTGATRHGDDFALAVEQADEPLLTEGSNVDERQTDEAREEEPAQR